MRKLKSNSGAVLIVAVIIIIAITVYMCGYVMWVVYDQHNMFRRLDTERAMELARAGLSRASVDLSSDSGWADGDINGNPIAPALPATSGTNIVRNLYLNSCICEVGTAACPTCPNAFYNVSITYLYNSTGSHPLIPNRVWIRSTGRVTSGANPTLRVLDQLFSQ